MTRGQLNIKPAYRTYFLLAFLLLLLPLTVLLALSRQETRKRAAPEEKMAIPPLSTTPPQPEYVPGEVLASFKNPNLEFNTKRKDSKLSPDRESVLLDDLQVNDPEINQLIQFLKANNIKKIERVHKKKTAAKEERLPEIYKLQFNEDQLKKEVEARSSPQDWLKFNSLFSKDSLVRLVVIKLKRSKYIKHVEPNYKIRLFETIPDDTYFAYQWALKNSANEANDISATSAWDITKGSPETIVAVTDTGIVFGHEDISQDNIWSNNEEIVNPGNGIDDDDNGYIDDYHGVNLVNRSSEPHDGHGHGTHVSGIVAATTNNAKGVAGVCWHCKIMTIKFIDDRGEASTDGAIEGITYAKDNGANIINASWGLGPSEFLKYAVQEALSQGVIFVAAAGNDYSQNISGLYPAGIPGVITVGSLSPNGERSDFSNYGELLDLLAPGENIFSTYRGEKYRMLSGTSMATPHVSGIAALIFSQGITERTEIAKRILGTTDELGTEGWDKDNGLGKPNAYNAVTNNKQITAAITNIQRYRYYSGEWLPIKGYAFAPDFSYYTIEIGQGDNPQNWTIDDVRLENEGRKEVIKDELGEFNYSQLADGVWTIRLTVFNTKGESKSFFVSLTKSDQITIYVDDDNTSDIENGSLAHPYRSIKRALENASDGVRIFVKSGTYIEEKPSALSTTLTIPYDNLTLEGEEVKSTIIRSTPFIEESIIWPVIVILEDDPDWLIENVKVRNLTIEAQGETAIQIAGFAENIEIENNRIMQNKPSGDQYGSDYGVQLNLFNDSTKVVGNYITNFTHNIFLQAIDILNTEIRNNYVFGGKYSGVTLHNFEGNRNTNISNNVFIKNKFGVVDWGYQETRLNKNIFLENQGTALAILSISPDTNLNDTVYHNSFIDNNKSGQSQVYFVNTPIVLLDDYFRTGNYWSNYDEDSEGAFDQDNNGIIDTPYIIDSRNKDDAPYKSNVGRGFPKPSVVIHPLIIYPDGAFIIATSEGAFGSHNERNKVILNWKESHQSEAEILSWTDKQIKAKLKNDILPGIYQVWLYSDRNPLPEFIGDAAILVVVKPEDYLILPTPPCITPLEFCNGTDNDCDGEMDEQACSVTDIQSWRASWAQADKTAADLDASGTLNILDYLILFSRWLE